MQVSVIIPTCNRNDTLPRAIYSALNQGVAKLEVIVVNDTDNPISNEILNIAITNPVTFTCNPGRNGAASARNYGVSLAKGKYITFLDDDDMYLPGRLNNMLNLTQQRKYIMVSSGRFYETGDFTTIQPAKKQRFGEIRQKDIQYQNDIDIGFMMERDIFLSFGGFDTSYKSLEDWDFILRVLEKGNCYKIKRMDYAVNLDPNRSRVSDRDSESYLKLAEMYKEKYGKEWFSYMSAHGLSLCGKLKFSIFIRNFSFRLFKSYLRQVKRAILK
ncbi:glycosyltransferase family 2 protein [Aeromonas bivalvium]|uniref:glycosyltransferase family 2 protein n=1 Tax=Aeromonas bivalvium TaxID=440079 RepID=UPI000A05F672|nr:glycosyltransferase family 2 protein [Aeromonas bivalvium]